MFIISDKVKLPQDVKNNIKQNMFGGQTASVIMTDSLWTDFKKQNMFGGAIA